MHSSFLGFHIRGTCKPMCVFIWVFIYLDQNLVWRLIQQWKTKSSLNNSKGIISYIWKFTSESIHWIAANVTFIFSRVKNSVSWKRWCKMMTWCFILSMTLSWSWFNWMTHAISQVASTCNIQSRMLAAVFPDMSCLFYVRRHTAQKFDSINHSSAKWGLSRVGRTLCNFLVVNIAFSFAIPLKKVIVILITKEKIQLKNGIFTFCFSRNYTWQFVCFHLCVLCELHCTFVFITNLHSIPKKKHSIWVW